MASLSAPRSTSRLSRTSRLLATLAYLIGAVALLIVALGPRNPFLVRHAQQAMVIHLIRLIAVTGVILTWYLSAEASPGLVLSDLTLHIGMLLLIGLPWPGQMSTELILLLGLPLGGPWILSIIGAAASSAGRSFDFPAAFSSSWPEEVIDRTPKMGTPEYDRWIGLQGSALDANTVSSGLSFYEAERGAARNTRDQRLERMWSASRVAQHERSRQDIMKELENRQDTVVVRLDHLNHLLSTGSISMTRYNRFNLELITYLDGLRSVMARVQSRAEGAGQAVGVLPAVPDAMTGAPDADASALAVIDLSGTPVVTYGHFAMDESLISGMVSVLDGLNEEMFGSRANMTQLADGDVVYYSKGVHVSAFVAFDDEPSPAQVQQLRDFVDAFESENAAPLSRSPVDSDRIVEIAVPFRFTRKHASY